MRSKTRNKKGRSNSRPVKAQPQQFSLKRLSNLLEKYGAASGEGTVEKLSQLAEQIVELIARNRKQRASSASYYRRRIE
jgi:hypothetical protein